ncbi:MAG: sugar ABC transporter substrate-binding protein [Microbacteriaceae bacterium]
MRRAAVAAAGLSLAVALTSCATGTGSSSATPDANKPVHLSISLVSASLAFAAETQAGAEQAAKDLNVKLDVTGPPLIDPPVAISQVENSLNTGVDGIGIGDEPAALWTRTLQDAMDKTNGNVVTFVAVPAAGSPAKTYVGIESKLYGVQLATETVKESGISTSTTGDVIVGQCFAGSDPLTNTSNAAIATLKKLLPSANVLPVFDSKLAPADNFAAWSQEIAANPNTVLTIGTCDQDGDSMAKAKAAAGGSFAIGTVQTSPAVLAGIASGAVAVALPQNYYVQGYTVVRLLAEAVRNGTNPPAGWIDPGVTVVTKANVADLVKRDSGAAGQAAFYAPLVTSTWADLSAITKPMAKAQG